METTITLNNSNSDVMVAEGPDVTIYRPGVLLICKGGLMSLCGRYTTLIERTGIKPNSMTQQLTYEQVTRIIGGRENISITTRNLHEPYSFTHESVNVSSFLMREFLKNNFGRDREILDGQAVHQQEEPYQGISLEPVSRFIGNNWRKLALIGLTAGVLRAGFVLGNELVEAGEIVYRSYDVPDILIKGAFVGLGNSLIANIFEHNVQKRSFAETMLDFGIDAIKYSTLWTIAISSSSEIRDLIQIYGRQINTDNFILREWFKFINMIRPLAPFAAGVTVVTQYIEAGLSGKLGGDKFAKKFLVEGLDVMPFATAAYFFPITSVFNIYSVIKHLVQAFREGEDKKWNQKKR